ncbi:unnamed protein product [Caenorhabditis sp. 36 PRJEB53466]|nr:unnamed protein product [Caenorhabditis sp. 36 PRJEB53466]
MSSEEINPSEVGADHSNSAGKEKAGAIREAGASSSLTVESETKKKAGEGLPKRPLSNEADSEKKKKKKKVEEGPPKRSRSDEIEPKKEKKLPAVNGPESKTESETELEQIEEEKSVMSITDEQMQNIAEIDDLQETEHRLEFHLKFVNGESVWLHTDSISKFHPKVIEFNERNPGKYEKLKRNMDNFKRRWTWMVDKVTNVKYSRVNKRLELETYWVGHDKPTWESTASFGELWRDHVAIVWFLKEKENSDAFKAVELLEEQVKKEREERKEMEKLAARGIIDEDDEMRAGNRKVKTIKAIRFKSTDVSFHTEWVGIKESTWETADTFGGWNHKAILDFKEKYPTQYANALKKKAQALFQKNAQLS